MRLLIVTLLWSITSLSMLPVAAANSEETVPLLEQCSETATLETVLSLMSQRLSLAEDVARYKWNQKTNIEDSAREQLIITKLVEQASKQGLPAAWAERFFRAQIEASKMIQQQLFVDWQHSHPAAFAAVPDLNTQTRPKLYALMSELIKALAKAWQPLHQSGCKPVLNRLVDEKFTRSEGKTASAPLFFVP